jgi:type IV pilus assembly protein PilY1
MKTSSIARRSTRFLARCLLPLAFGAATLASAQSVDLADKPLFSTTSVPGNLLLDLSVEYPTANSAGYFSTSAYAPATLYLGYFDGAKCYSYVYNSTTPASSYFQGDSLATSGHLCTSTAAKPLWSGNWLNYASMLGLDVFRWVLTGGNRIVDTTGSGGMTILQRAVHSGQGGAGDAPNKTLTSANQPGATPFNWSGGNNTRIWGAGIKLWVTGSNTDITGTVTSADYKAQYCSSCNSGTDSDGNAYKTVVYALYMNVRVCDSTVGVETNCVLYGSKYKPEGLMQQYAQTLRYGAFGYLGDSDKLRDGGVLRARMAYVGPLVPVPGSASTTNATPEWNATTGVMYANPDPTDATDTNTFTGGKTSVAQSGVMNYLNKFGYAYNTYKTYDPVGELYYASLRYLKGQSNVSAYTSVTAGAPSTATVQSWVDGSPVITDWTSKPAYDPILYSCQKNFILGIGDVNTHRDGNLPSSSLTASEPTKPSEVTADTGTNVTTSTNAVGTMEGTTTTLGSTYVGGDLNTYYMAGLAYDAHVPVTGKGVRTYTDATTGLTTIATASTYWLDVQEYQTYVKNNVYYYATKYGGFNVPKVYAYGTAPTLDSWYTTTNTQGSGGSLQSQPDNYFTASNATQMQSGLTTAFAKIVAENNAANGTALSVPTPNVTSAGAMSYSATYDPTSWTGQVIGSTVAFAADGTPTLTQQWDARALLSATTVTAATRKIVTCCTTSTTAPGLAFTNTALTSSTLIGRTYLTSFSAVPGVASGSQNTANYIAYLRGDTSKEVANGGAYRTRAFRLGDIVNAKPVTVGPPSFPFYDSYNAGYSAFKALYATRNNVVYGAANDGMLHAFDGTVGNSTSGGELFAYIPSFTYGTASTASTTGLASLGNPSFTHHYLVDSTPGQFDIDFSKTGGSTSTGAANWHTLVIGGLGKGGKGYYALDVTDPTSWTTEATVATKVMWEFTDSHMGYTYGTPSLVKTKKYGWVAIMTSGYSNSDGLGYFFFVNPVTGALLETVSTPTGSNSAGALDLGQQTTYIPDYTDMTADAIYAGDLQGNVWRVDLSATDLTLPYPTATKIAAFGNTQPITTRPLVETPINSSVRYVLVGTGKLLADSDIATSATQSIYAIIDGSGLAGQFYGTTANPLPATVSFPITRSDLNANSSLLTGIGSSPTSAMGWYYDLPVSSSPAIAQRVNVDPYADVGIVAFIGNTPNGSVCSPSGTGTLYGVNFATGQSVLLDSTSTTLVASALIAGGGVGTDVTIVAVNGTPTLLTGGSTGTVAKAPANLTTQSGVTQINWRDVPSTN